MDVFEESPLMSTYLVAFTLGEYEFVSVPADGLSFELGIWIRKQYLEQLELAKKTLVGALKFYTDYFKVNFALKKLHIVAVFDQNRGGMESYGMITLT